MRERSPKIRRKRPLPSTHSTEVYYATDVTPDEMPEGRQQQFKSSKLHHMQRNMGHRNEKSAFKRLLSSYDEDYYRHNQQQQRQFFNVRRLSSPSETSSGIAAACILGLLAIMLSSFLIYYRNYFLSDIEDDEDESSHEDGLKGGHQKSSNRVIQDGTIIEQSSEEETSSSIDPLNSHDHIRLANHRQGSFNPSSHSGGSSSSSGRNIQSSSGSSYSSSQYHSDGYDYDENHNNSNYSDASSFDPQDDIKQILTRTQGDFNRKTRTNYDNHQYQPNQGMMQHHQQQLLQQQASSSLLLGSGRTSSVLSGLSSIPETQELKQLDYDQELWNRNRDHELQGGATTSNTPNYAHQQLLFPAAAAAATATASQQQQQRKSLPGVFIIGNKTNNNRGNTEREMPRIESTSAGSSSSSGGRLSSSGNVTNTSSSSNSEGYHMTEDQLMGHIDNSTYSSNYGTDSARTERISNLPPSKRGSATAAAIVAATAAVAAARKQQQEQQQTRDRSTSTGTNYSNSEDGSSSYDWEGGLGHSQQSDISSYGYIDRSDQKVYQDQRQEQQNRRIWDEQTSSNQHLLNTATTVTAATSHALIDKVESLVTTQHLSLQEKSDSQYSHGINSSSYSSDECASNDEEIDGALAALTKINRNYATEGTLGSTHSMEYFGDEEIDVHPNEKPDAVLRHPSSNASSSARVPFSSSTGNEGYMFHEAIPVGEIDGVHYDSNASSFENSGYSSSSRSYNEYQRRERSNVTPIGTSSEISGSSSTSTEHNTEHTTEKQMLHNYNYGSWRQRILHTFSARPRSKEFHERLSYQAEERYDMKKQITDSRSLAGSSIRSSTHGSSLASSMDREDDTLVASNRRIIARFPPLSMSKPFPHEFNGTVPDVLETLGSSDDCTDQSQRSIEAQIKHEETELEWHENLRSLPYKFNPEDESAHNESINDSESSIISSSEASSLRFQTIISNTPSDLSALVEEDQISRSEEDSQEEDYSDFELSGGPRISIEVLRQHNYKAYAAQDSYDRKGAGKDQKTGKLKKNKRSLEKHFMEQSDGSPFHIYKGTSISTGYTGETMATTLAESEYCGSDTQSFRSWTAEERKEMREAEDNFLYEERRGSSLLISSSSNHNDPSLLNESADEEWEDVACDLMLKVRKLAGMKVESDYGSDTNTNSEYDESMTTGSSEYEVTDDIRNRMNECSINIV